MNDTVENNCMSAEYNMLRHYEKILVQLDNPRIANKLELRNERILVAVREFYEKPSHPRKEEVLRLVTQASASEIDIRGKHVGCTDRFNVVLSLIYLYGYLMRFPELKLYAYRCLVVIAISEHTLESLSKEIGFEYTPYSSANLSANLLIYYHAYCWFRYTDEYESLFSAIVDVVDSCGPRLDKEKDFGSKFEAMRIIYDLALTTGFDELDCYHSYLRDDISHIFAGFSRWLHEYPSLIGTPYSFCTRISVILASMILRLRNKLDNFPVIKYVKDEPLESSFNNNQVWMSTIEKLNDPREGKVFEEMLSEEGALHYKWQKLCKTNLRFFVGCFSRNTNPNDMKRYGNNGLGYKNDNIASKLAPVSLDADGHALLARVLSYDVAYSKEKAKEEVEFASNLIDNLPVIDSLKTAIFTMFVSRVRYSVKDIGWENEQERRYIIELKDEAEFIDAVIEDGYFKVESSLFQHPDYLLSCSDAFRNRFEANAISHILNDITVPCSLCNDCLSISFHRGDTKCRECGKSNLRHFEGRIPL